MKQVVGDNLGICVLNLQIVQEKSRPLDLELLNHLIKKSCDFMEGSSSLCITTLPGLVAIGIVVVGIKYF